MNNDFVGNVAVSDWALSNVITSQTAAWYRFFSQADLFHPERLKYDQQSLYDYYQEKGYADFRNISATAELTADGKSFIVTFLFDE